MEQQIPLSHEASAGDTNMRVTHELPSEVVQCLENARFLHLATCVDNIPHVSLMNYTYLASSPYSSGAPVVVMTTNPASKKMNNLVANPNVSLLVHDCMFLQPAVSPASSSSMSRIITRNTLRRVVYIVRPLRTDLSSCRRGIAPSNNYHRSATLIRWTVLARPGSAGAIVVARRSPFQPQHKRCVIYKRHDQRFGTPC